MVGDNFVVEMIICTRQSRGGHSPELKVEQGVELNMG
jgi:hypothetical protein